MSADTDLTAYVNALTDLDTKLQAAGASLTAALAAEQAMRTSQAGAGLRVATLEIKSMVPDQLKLVGLDLVGTTPTGIPGLTAKVTAFAAGLRAANAAY